MAMTSCLRCLGMAGSSVNNKNISVIGTGNYGAAIGKRLVQYGYDVTYGSRRPSSRNMATVDPSLAQTAVVDIGAAILKHNVIIFAVRVASFKTIAEKYSTLLAGKIVIDVSNRSRDVDVSQSNAEFLQSLLPDSSVVKAFNVISAYTLESGLDGSTRVVPIASEDSTAKEVVANLVMSLDFSPKDAGRLSASREIESSVLEVLPLWRFPLAVTLGLFVLWWLYIVYLYFIRRNAFTWEQLFLKIFNKPLAMTAVNMFALTYFPGCLAAGHQLYHGTKYKRFPHWLDYWMRRRKQLGLTAFTLASVHVLASAMMLSPTYYSSWFHQTRVLVSPNASQGVDVVHVLPVKAWMLWKGEVSCLTGVVCFFVFCVTAVTSFPSVGQTLNWAEWRFVQSRLGNLGLFLAVAHAYCMGIPSWVKYQSLSQMFRSITFTSTIFPAFVVVLNLLLLSPGLRGRLRKIRRGWEKSNGEHKEEHFDVMEIEKFKPRLATSVSGSSTDEVCCCNEKTTFPNYNVVNESKGECCSQTKPSSQPNDCCSNNRKPSVKSSTEDNSKLLTDANHENNGQISLV